MLIERQCDYTEIKKEGMLKERERVCVREKKIASLNKREGREIKQRQKRERERGRGEIGWKARNEG